MKKKKTARKIALAKPATRRKCAKVVGRAGGYATAAKKRRRRK